jgi:hypothetical protein
LQEANFSMATLQSVNFSGADLTSATFDGATLREVDFTDAKLDDAVFTNTAGYGIIGASSVCPRHQFDRLDQHNFLLNMEQRLPVSSS